MSKRAVRKGGKVTCTEAKVPLKNWVLELQSSSLVRSQVDRVVGQMSEGGSRRWRLERRKSDADEDLARVHFFALSSHNPCGLSWRLHKPSYDCSEFAWKSNFLHATATPYVQEHFFLLSSSLVICSLWHPLMSDAFLPPVGLCLTFSSAAFYHAICLCIWFNFIVNQVKKPAQVAGRNCWHNVLLNVICNPNRRWKRDKMHHECIAHNDRNGTKGSTFTCLHSTAIVQPCKCQTKTKMDKENTNSGNNWINHMQYKWYVSSIDSTLQRTEWIKESERHKCHQGWNQQPQANINWNWNMSWISNLFHLWVRRGRGEGEDKNVRESSHWLKQWLCKHWLK